MIAVLESTAAKALLSAQRPTAIMSAALNTNYKMLAPIKSRVNCDSCGEMALLPFTV